MRLFFVLLVWFAVAWATYPLGLALKAAVGPQFGLPLQPEPWFSASFLVTQLLAFAGLGAFSPIRAGTIKTAAVTAVAWAVAGHGLWLALHVLLGTASTLDRATLAFTTATQVGLSFLAAGVALNLVASAAVVVAAPLIALAYPLRPMSATALDLVPFLTFVVANAATYAVLVARSSVTSASPARYVLFITRWIIAAHVVWLLLLFFSIGLQGLPRALPLGTGTMAWIVAVAAPLAVLVFTGRLNIYSLNEHSASDDDPKLRISLERGPESGKRTAWIISYTGVSNEPRVLRQSRALLDDGWRVVVCGYDGHSVRPVDWTFVRLPSSDPYLGTVGQILAIPRVVGQMLAVFGWPVPLAKWGARLHHLCLPNWMHIRRSVLQLSAANPDLKPDLVLCNDYFTCDVGYALARRYGARLAVDCHEYAAEQNAHDAAWVKWARPYVTAVQDYYLTRADVVSTVCEGIADLLNKDHALKRPAIVVRSVPTKQIQTFRPTGDRIKVLYHGGIWHVRQLHIAIESMRTWRPEFDLVLRGNGDASYIAELRRLAQRYGLEKRIFFEPSVPFEKIIPEANKADIGYFSYANFSRQSQFVLPNKFFEYVMSGLALCIIDLTEMGRLTRRHELGKCIPEHKPQAIADTINSFSRAEIDRCKRNSLVAAEELNWDHEKQVMIAAYNELYGKQSGSPTSAFPERRAASIMA